MIICFIPRNQAEAAYAHFVPCTIDHIQYDKHSENIYGVQNKSQISKPYNIYSHFRGPDNDLYKCNSFVT